MIRCAVLGSPIAHSLSPVIHQRAYEILGWPWQYDRFDVPSGGLANFFNANHGIFRGLSLTMPLKEESLALLDTVTDLAKRVNAVNTIIFDELGVHGHNTDVQGFMDALGHHQIGIPEEVSILGGGATARAAIAAVDGSAKVINVFSRSDHRANSLVNSAEKSIVRVLPWGEASTAFDAPLIIGTTPRGATDHIEIAETSFIYFESLYNPWPTPLLSKWRAAGGIGLDGIDLLVWQAIGQLELMAWDSAEVISQREELHGAMRLAALSHLQ